MNITDMNHEYMTIVIPVATWHRDAIEGEIFPLDMALILLMINMMALQRK